MSGERSLARLAEQTFERRGDYPALFFEGVWHTSAGLFERATRVAAGLVERGIRPGDRVVVLMENSPDVGIAYHAIWRVGAVATPAVFLLSREELERLIGDSEPELVLTSPAFADTARAAAGASPVVADLAELEADEPAPLVFRDDAELAALVYTGGTTGRAKGVMLTHANLWEAGRRGHEAGHVPGIDRSLSCLPLAHSYGLLVLNVGLHHPERPQSVLMRWFDPESWLQLAQEHRVQIAPVVPSMLYVLLAQPLEDYDLSSLRFVASGAAPLARGAIEEFVRRVPGVQIREGYGLTETSALVSTNPPGRCKHGTVGPPVPGTDVRIVDGEVCVRSELVMAGYWNEPELTAETIRDGWLYTGDMGRIDEDGYLMIVDRKKDLIIRGGFNVFPRDVEEALLEHPAVATACVLGRPDAVYGEEVVAFVTVTEETDEETLVAFGRERLGGYKYPREIHVVGALPLTPVGKADRKALRELLTQGGVTG
ncbi:MAG TPA: AMP-binding protein [Gaiellaceae bacterium]|nr:AMP-binding protein [Gaiellaceae bacterium]